MLVEAGFEDIKITVKENAAEFIKDWMPGSGAEKYISSAYVTAVKPTASWGVRDNVRANVSSAAFAAAAALSQAASAQPEQTNGAADSKKTSASAGC